MKLFPGNLGMTVFDQVLSDVDDMDQKGLDTLFKQQ